jgi:hypothetical protein
MQLQDAVQVDAIERFVRRDCVTASGARLPITRQKFGRGPSRSWQAAEPRLVDRPFKSFLLGHCFASVVKRGAAKCCQRNR